MATADAGQLNHVLFSHNSVTNLDSADNHCLVICSTEAAAFQS